MDLAAQLAEAREQYHALLTGQSPSVIVDQNGERIEYRPASAGKLADYITQLEAQLAGLKRPNTIRFCTSKGL
jgi:hypothetical protein